jgi:hypothetical protein
LEIRIKLFSFTFTLILDNFFAMIQYVGRKTA